MIQDEYREICEIEELKATETPGVYQLIVHAPSLRTKGLTDVKAYFAVTLNYYTEVT